MSLLRKFVPREALNAVWQRARRGDVSLKQQCPGCSNRMKEVPVETQAGLHCEVDVCTHCQSVWLDGGEWHDLANLKVRKLAPRSDVRAEVRERIAEKRRARNGPPPLKARESTSRPIEARRRSSNAAAEASRLRARAHERRVDSESAESRGWGEGPTEFWHWLPALFGMPVEDAQPKGHHNDSERALLTWTLAIGIFLVSALAMFDLEALIRTYGLIPAEFDRLGGLTWLTSFFLHVGPIHLLGNLYFLVIFGDNVEKCFGSLELFLLIVVAAVFGDFVHICFDPSSTIPCVGASGGISGVIAFYALRFPKTRLSMMFWLIKPFWFRMSAIWMLFLWILMQVVISGQQLAGLSGISGGAHLGGAFVGFVAWLLWRCGGGERDCRNEVAYRSAESAL